MAVMKNKIDFVLVIGVENANPNGDPLNGNIPRTDFSGHGEISDVCLKRKVRNRLQGMGLSIFLQSDDRCDDGMTSLANRAKDENVGLGADTFNAKKTSREDAAWQACQKWVDVRALGQIFAFKGGEDAGGVSIGIRGPVTLHPAISVEPVEIVSTQITKSVNGEGDGSKRGADTMGMKHRVGVRAFYVCNGSISVNLAEKTGLTDNDVENVKQALLTLFEDDASAARPEGSMWVEKLVWFTHRNKTGQYSTRRVHQSVKVDNEGKVDVNPPGEDLKFEVLEGF